MNMFEKISPASGSTQGVEPYLPINISVFSPKQPICSPSLYTEEGEVILPVKAKTSSSHFWLPTTEGIIAAVAVSDAVSHVSHKHHCWWCLQRRFQCWSSHWKDSPLIPNSLQKSLSFLPYSYCQL
ncbi:unnamed protein product [Eretmochelys imbricata]